ncbi:MAG: pyridoxamine 5'-phosphate oxidase family protein [Spirochaetota bacterium]
MRRNDKAITDQQEIVEVLTSSKICRLALCDDSTPYIVPVNFGYKDNAIYIHTAKQGRKIEILKKNNNVCFEVERDVHIVPSDNACKWGTHYTCVIGYGRAELLSDYDSLKEALEIIMKQQSGRRGWKYKEKNLKRVLIIKINIDSISGKRSG